jgi:hypothetical protein
MRKEAGWQWYHSIGLALKVHKRDNFFGSDFEISTFFIVGYAKILKFFKIKCFDWASIKKDTIFLRILSIRRTKDFQQAR